MAESFNQVTKKSSAWSQRGKDFPLMAGIISVVALMIIPLPSLMLDILLAVNITIAVLILLTAVYVTRPLDFSVFPALLLMTTLFRLGLNVASTRLILQGAANSNPNVSQIIETFGHFVVGGNSLIGIIIFLILVLINFMVITKGSGRIAEVAARFTLDALPGKQMSIDAEHAAGALTDEQAREKRSEIERESEFYGAMDGASKFVRGDAIAGLIITAINIAGGLFIAIVQGGMGFGYAAETYTVLTVGDGLVSQIPALFISTATGIVVTRAASATDFSDELGSQLVGSDRVLYGAAAVMVLLGLIPGMPLPMFAGLAGLLGWLGYRVSTASARPATPVQVDEKEAAQELTNEEPDIAQMLRVDTLTLEIGYGLVPLVDEKKGGTLLNRLVQMRAQFANELGIIVPPIHIRDNLELQPDQYRLLLKGTSIGGAVLMSGRLLAIDPGFVSKTVPGTATTDPAFGLKAVWIDPKHRYDAESAGYTVVELDSVITTHASEMLGRHAADLFGWQELQDRLELIKEENPKLIDELIPGIIKFGDVLKILRRLLAEGISIRDLRTILEALAENGGDGMSVTAQADEVRARLASQISTALMNDENIIHAALLDRPLEEQLRQCLVTQHGEPILACDLSTAQSLFAEIEEAMSAFAMKDSEPVILSPPDLRSPLQQFLAQFFPNIHVISHREVIQRAQIISVAQLKLTDPNNPNKLTG